MGFHSLFSIFPYKQVITCRAEKVPVYNLFIRKCEVCVWLNFQESCCVEGVRAGWFITSCFVAEFLLGRTFVCCCFFVDMRMPYLPVYCMYKGKYNKDNVWDTSDCIFFLCSAADWRPIQVGFPPRTYGFRGQTPDPPRHWAE